MLHSTHSLLPCVPLLSSAVTAALIRERHLRLHMRDELQRLRAAIGTTQSAAITARQLMATLRSEFSAAYVDCWEQLQRTSVAARDTQQAHQDSAVLARKREVSSPSTHTRAVLTLRRLLTTAEL